MTGPRVRALHRLIVQVRDGRLDADEVRRAADLVPAGADVVVVVRGGVIGPEPGVAGLLGRSLARCRTISVEGGGPWVRTFAAMVEDAASVEAATA